MRENIVFCQKLNEDYGQTQEYMDTGPNCSLCAHIVRMNSIFVVCRASTVRLLMFKALVLAPSPPLRNAGEDGHPRPHHRLLPRPVREELVGRRLRVEALPAVGDVLRADAARLGVRPGGLAPASGPCVYRARQESGGRGLSNSRLQNIVLCVHTVGGSDSTSTSVFTGRLNVICGGCDSRGMGAK